MAWCLHDVRDDWSDLHHKAWLEGVVVFRNWQRLSQKCVEALEDGGHVVVAASTRLSSLEQPLLHLFLRALQEDHQPRPPDLICNHSGKFHLQSHVL
jgi:hypothetical protein